MRQSISIVFTVTEPDGAIATRSKPSDEDSLMVADAIAAAEKVLRNAGCRGFRTAHNYETQPRWKIWAEPAMERGQVEAYMEANDA